MADLYKLASEGISKQEFLDSFKNVVAIVARTNAEMLKRSDDSLAALTKEMKMLYAEIKATATQDIAAAKAELKIDITKALKEQEQGMKFIYDKVRSIESGEPGEDGDDGHTPTEDELLAIIKPLIPKVENGKNADPVDIDAIVAQVVAKIPARGQVGWGAHPLRILDSSGNAIDKVTRHIKFTGATTTRSADGVVTVAISGGGGGFSTLAATETPNGVKTVFTFSTATAQPSFLMVDNVWQKAVSKAGTVNWTWASGPKQATLSVPPNDDILGIV